MHRQLLRTSARGIPARGLSQRSCAYSTEQERNSVDTNVSAFEQNVGNTKLVRLKRASEVAGCNILAKCEYENAGGSIKDRAALWMVRDAEKRGLLIRGEPATIVEGTAGNTGIGLALAAGVFGYKCVICIASTQSEEKKNLLRSFGAQLIEVPAVPFKDPNNYVHVAQRVAETLRKKGHRAFYANQWDNTANRAAHIASTGPEVWRQSEGKIDAFSCAMGTGGTLAGMSMYFKENHPHVKIGLTDPQGAAMVNWFTSGELKGEGSSISEGIGQGRVTGNMEGFQPDMCFEIPDAEMMPVLHDLQRFDGLSLGGSSGINVAGAIQVGKELGPGSTVVTVLCDSASRYSSKLNNPQFLESKGLPVAPWLRSHEEQESLDPDYFGLLRDATGEALV
mmetsp:Transcript_1531/g.2424  ORF Transcript_1531/g.2424 Transcript_1531/m.2424 type:complete len:394 (+) Transcript_1531:79-1260(+)